MTAEFVLDKRFSRCKTKNSCAIMKKILEAGFKVIEICTIGYSSFSVENFIKTLKKYAVTCLVDVRSLPKSAHFKDYDRENLAFILKRNNIIYRNYAKEFGARQTDRKFYTDGALDFDKFSESEQFISGVKKIEKGMELGYKFALMCAEKRPETCHRNILIAKKFHELGYIVQNILADGSFITQTDVEKILLDKYFPDRNQFSLFEEMSEAEMIRQSYKKQSLEIAYRGDEKSNEDALHDRFH